MDTPELEKLYRSLRMGPPKPLTDHQRLELIHEGHKLLDEIVKNINHMFDGIKRNRELKELKHR